jgi:hypothetical protein
MPAEGEASGGNPTAAGTNRAALAAGAHSERVSAPEPGAPDATLARYRCESWFAVERSAFVPVLLALFAPTPLRLPLLALGATSALVGLAMLLRGERQAQERATAALRAAERPAARLCVACGCRLSAMSSRLSSSSIVS